MDINNLRKKVGKLFIFGFKGKEVDDHVKKLIYEYNVGSLILFSHNLGTKKEIKKLTDDIQKEAKLAGYDRPILICIDQENGLVNRLNDINFYLPGAMSIGATSSEEISEDVGNLTAKYLRKLGINWNLAPVLDINTNPNNPGIGIRSFSDDPNLAKKLAYAFIKGHNKNNVLTTIKHFPGLGNTSVDPHFGLPVVNKNLEELEEKELIPFKYAIENGVDSVMTSHVLFPNIKKDDYPVTMSKTFLTDILKDKMGFNGVVVTDCLEMDAISKEYGVGNGAINSFKAGADLIIVSHTPEEQYNAADALVKAIEDKEIELEDLDKSISRINKLYEKIEKFYDVDDEEIDFSKVEKYFINSVTLLKNESFVDKNQKVIALVPNNERRQVGEKSDEKKQRYLADSVKDNIKNVEFIYYDKTNLKEKLELIYDIKDSNQIIFGLLSNELDENIENSINDIASSKEFYTIAMRDPYPNKVVYDISKSYINTYQASPIPIDIAVKSLVGKISPKGKLPVKLSFK